MAYRNYLGDVSTPFGKPHTPFWSTLVTPTDCAGPPAALFRTPHLEPYTPHTRPAQPQPTYRSTRRQMLLHNTIRLHKLIATLPLCSCLCGPGPPPARRPEAQHMHATPNFPRPTSNVPELAPPHPSPCTLTYTETPPAGRGKRKEDWGAGARHPTPHTLGTPRYLSVTVFWLRLVNPLSLRVQAPTNPHSLTPYTISRVLRVPHTR